jgi:hypothetical protein
VEIAFVDRGLVVCEGCRGLTCEFWVVFEGFILKWGEVAWASVAIPVGSISQMIQDSLAPVSIGVCKRGTISFFYFYEMCTKKFDTYVIV